MTDALKLIKDATGSVCSASGLPGHLKGVSMSMRFLFPALAGLLLTGCAATRIGRINADPSRYQNRDVRVEGSVVTSFGALGAGGYQVDDGTGKIYVLST